MRLKRIFAVTVILLLTFSISAFASAIGVVNTDVLNFRSGPGTGYTKIGQVVRGESVQIIEHVNSEWAKVSYNGKEGYLCTTYLNVRQAELTDRNSVSRPAQSGIYCYVSATSLNLRNQPSTESVVVASIPQYTQLSNVKDCGDGWGLVNYNGVDGYIALSYTVAGEAPKSPVNTSLGQQIVEFAKKYLGKPYVYGANGPNSFDCSGFTKFVYKNFGFNLNRTAASQTDHGYYVSKDQLQPGDLVFFKPGSYVNHVGIYIGDGMMIHASSAGDTVKYSSIMSGYHCDYYYTARRLI